MSEQSPEDRLDTMTGWLQQALMSGGDGDFETWRVGPGKVGVQVIAPGDNQERVYLVRVGEVDSPQAVGIVEADPCG